MGKNFTRHMDKKTLKRFFEKTNHSFGICSLVSLEKRGFVFTFIFLLFFTLFLASCSSGENYYAQGKKSWQQKQELSALYWFTKALQENPRHAMAHFYTAKLLEEKDITRTVALQHYLEVLQNPKADKDILRQSLFAALQISFSVHDYEKTKELAETSLEARKSYEPLYLFAAKASLALNDKQVAREYAESGLKKFPYSVSLALLLGDIVNQEYKQYYLGLKFYQQAEQRAPQDEQVLLRLAFGYNLIGNYVKATHYLDRLIQKDRSLSQEYMHYQKLLAVRGWREL